MSIHNIQPCLISCITLCVVHIYRTHAPLVATIRQFILYEFWPVTESTTATARQTAHTSATFPRFPILLISFRTANTAPTDAPLSCHTTRASRDLPQTATRHQDVVVRKRRTDHLRQGPTKRAGIAAAELLSRRSIRYTLRVVWVRVWVRRHVET